MAVMDPQAGLMVLINTFHVDRDRGEQLIELLRDATETVMRTLPGFVSANLHMSDDGTRIVNYAQWRSQGDFETMQADPRAQEHMAAAGRLAKSSDPVIYQLRFSEG